MIDHVRAGKNKFPQYVEKTLGLSHEAGEAAGQQTTNPLKVSTNRHQDNLAFLFRMYPQLMLVQAIKNLQN